MTDYNQVKAVNNSLLKYLDPQCGGSPSKFWEQFNNPKETEPKPWEIFGSALHCYILEPDKFEERYAVEQFERDSITKLIEENLALQSDYSFNELTDLLATDYMNKKNAKKEETRTKHYKEKLAELKRYEAQFDFIKSCNSKTRISQLDYDKIVKIYFNIQTHPQASQLIGDLTETEHEVYNLEESIPTKCKLDGISRTKGYIIDLKTTSDSVYNFPKWFEEYKYYRQAAFYQNAIWVQSKYKELPDFYFIVCSTQDCSIAVYKVSDKYLAKVDEELKSLFQEIQWQYDHPENNWKYFSWEVENDYLINI